jgi:hypothetical protein
MAFRHFYSGLATFGQWRMVTKRLQSLVEEFERAEERELVDNNAARALKEAHKAFETLWEATYSSDLFQSQEFITETVDGLLRLRVPINVRLWEYRLVLYADYPTLTMPAKVAVQLLLEAIFRERSDVEASLKRLISERSISSGLLSAIVRAHSSMYTSLAEIRATFFLPDLNRIQCAKVLGMKKDKFYYELKRHRVVNKSPENRRYKRRGNWVHNDPAIHEAGLRRMLELFPEKIWSPHE